MLGVKDFSFTNLWTNAVYNFQEELNHLAFPAPSKSRMYLFLVVQNLLKILNILNTKLSTTMMKIVKQNSRSTN